MIEEQDREQAVADCLEDYHRRRARGERPQVEDYTQRLGDAHDAFLEVLAAESAFDVALAAEAEEPFPRPMGPYTLLRELGRGAVGVVYEAMHRELGRKVALKVLRTGFDVDETARERFRREARACAQVRHPHIVEIYEVGEHERRPYYSMTLVAGYSLHELRKYGKMPAAEKLFEQVAGVAAALDALHKAGIVHRDVKPSNIMVDENGVMVLADFGLARTAAAERLTQTGQALGTPMYMSPEQVLGKTAEIDGRSDVYGLGASVYEALAGRALFTSREPMAVMRMILKERPDPLHEVAPDVPRNASNIVMKALEKRQDDRYESAEAMRADLLAFARGQTVVGKPVGATALAARRARGYWKVSLAAAALLAVGAWVWQTRPGTVHVLTIPVADVLVNGEPHGLAPVDVELAPGEHLVQARAERFKPYAGTVQARAWHSEKLLCVLDPLNPEDPKAIRQICDGLGIDPGLLVDRRTRALPVEAPVTPMLPRGRVRVVDLQAFRVDVSRELPPGGTVRFYRGDELLLSQPFEPVVPVTIAEIGSALLDSLRAGDEIVWGYYPDDGEPVTAACTIAPRTVTDRSVELAEVLRGASDTLARHVLAHYFLEEHLFTAAFRTAHSAAEQRPQSERAWAVMQTALYQMDLDDTLLYMETTKGLDAVPEEERGHAIER